MGAPVVSYEEFSRLDIRVARISKAERIEGSRKLLRLMVSLGELGERQIVAGIGEHYDPGDLIGKYIVIVSNLKPKKIMGVISQGMLLAAGCEKGSKPVLLTVDGPVAEGERVC